MIVEEPNPASVYAARPKIEKTPDDSVFLPSGTVCRIHLSFLPSRFISSGGHASRHICDSATEYTKAPSDPPEPKTGQAVKFAREELLAAYAPWVPGFTRSPSFFCCLQC